MKAVIENRTASLVTDFGELYARRLFGDIAIDNLPVYSRGSRKGLLKGSIVWKKCTRGGWVNTVPGEPVGYVQKPGLVSARILSEYDGTGCVLLTDDERSKRP